MSNKTCIAILSTTGLRCWDYAEKNSHYCTFHTSLVKDVGEERFELNEIDHVYRRKLGNITERYEENIRTHQKNNKKLQELNETFKKEVSSLKKEYEWELSLKLLAFQERAIWKRLQK
jgi:hypothetical protein